MKRRMYFVMAVFLFVVSSASAKSMNAAIQFEAIDFACEGGNIIVSMEPLIAGTSIVTVTDVIKNTFFVDSTFFPTAFPGSTWVLPGRGHFLPNDTFVVHHQGYGTGELEGGMIKLKVNPVDVAPPPDCVIVGPIVKLDGVIIFPPGQAR